MLMFWLIAHAVELNPEGNPPLSCTVVRPEPAALVDRPVVLMSQYAFETVVRDGEL